MPDIPSDTSYDGCEPSGEMFTWISGIIQHGGVWGVLLLMTLENVFPPLPSELIVPMAGYVAGSDIGKLVAFIAAGTVGSVVGAIVWYAIGARIGPARVEQWSNRHGRWLMFSPAEFRRAIRWFNHWGFLAVLVGRMLPGVRGVICIPAGVAWMPFALFLVASTVGSLLWTTILALAGRLLASHYATVQHWLDPVSGVFAAMCATAYLLRVITYRRSA